MLPDAVVERFSLDHGSRQPAISLYLDVSLPDYTVRVRPSCLEQVGIAANLRHAEYDTLNELFVSGGSRRHWKRSAASRASAPGRTTIPSTSRTVASESCDASAARRSTSWSRS